MPAKFIWHDATNAVDSTLPWTTVQRTSSTAVTTRRLFNETTGSTATSIFLRAEYQINAGDPFLSSGVEPADSAWLLVRATGTVYNPSGGTGPEYQAWSSPWTSVGSAAVFAFGAPIPPNFSRELEFKLKPEGTGATSTINAVKITADWDRGLATLPAFSVARHGDHIIYRGEMARYSVVRGYELDGIKVKAHDPPLYNRIVIEGGRYQVGVHGLGRMVTVAPVIPSPTLDGSGAAVGAGEEYTILVTKDSTGFSVGDYTLTKGSKAATGNSIAPSSPGLNDIPIATFIVDGTSAIQNAAITNIAYSDAGTLRYDGSGNDVDADKWLSLTGGIIHVSEGRNSVAGLANAEHYAKVSTQGVMSVDTTAPAAGEQFLGRVTVAGGAVTVISQRQVYDGSSAYQSRMREMVSPTLTPDSSGVVQAFGRWDNTVSGNVIQATTTQTVTAAGGHHIAARVSTLNSAGWLKCKGTTIDGAGTELARANGPVEVTSLLFGSIPAGTVITVDLQGTTTALTEGVDWNVGASNNATATSIASAINGLAGITAWASSAVVTARPDNDTQLLGVTHDTLYTYIGVTTSEVQAVTVADQWLLTEARFMGTNSRTADVTLLAVDSDWTITVNNYLGLAGDTVTLTYQGTAHTLTEGVDWTAATSNAATATSLGAAIDALTGVTADVIADISVSMDNKLDDVVITTSAGADLTLTRVGLDCTVTAGRANPWDNRGGPCHLAKLQADWVGATDAASLRVRLYKVPRSGAVVTVFDSGTKASFGTGSAGVPMTLDLSLSGGTECNTQARWNAAPAAFVDPFSGEWVYAEVSGATDIESVRLTLFWFDNFSS